jgi:hypothetical protein
MFVMLVRNTDMVRAKKMYYINRKIQISMSFISKESDLNPKEKFHEMMKKL